MIRGARLPRLRYVLGMGELAERIRRAARENRYLFSDHADNMLRERGIMHWQMLESLEHGTILTERPSTRPNPTVEVEQILADGTPVKAVWAYVRALDSAKLVTVHFFDS
jgi:hypothetical protein